MTIPTITGIIGAMPEEISGITAMIENRKEVSIGGRIYHQGIINGRDVVVVFSRWGKVAAASTAATLILKFGIDELVFTGVAGALQSGMNIGDIVIGQRMFQHDLDARPLIRRFEIPLLGLLYLECDSQQVEKVKTAAERALLTENLMNAIKINGILGPNGRLPAVYIGDIASGDKFVSNSSDKHALNEMLPNVLCVEMEGAAVAQVCHEFGIPWAIIRVISDTADESSNIDFQLFIRDVSKIYTASIISGLLKPST